MEIVKCERKHLDMAADLYERVVAYLEETVNYPKWSKEYPCRETVLSSILRGEQYGCVEEGRMIGGFVLNDNPGGDYGVGTWKKRLSPGEFLVIHTLAVDPSAGGRGVGGFMVDFCIQWAKGNGYKAIRLDVIPDNRPAIRLYERKGFSFAGRGDLDRGIEEIPVFDLFELNF